MNHFSRFASIITLIATSSVSAQEDYATWSYRKDITINTSSTGANVTADVVSFPLLVRLTPASGGDVVHFSSGRGADLRFTKANGTTRLKHQIERWDSAQQVADVWVLVDTVKGGNASQAIRMYWGKAGAADSSRGSSVFDTANGYVGVWHLGERLGHASRPNAIAGRFSAAPRNFAPGYHRSPGVAGWSDSLTGGSSSGETTFLAVNEGTATTHYNFPDGRFSFSAWIYPAETGNFARIFSLVREDVTNGDDDRIFMAFQNGNIVGRQWAAGGSRATNSTTPPILNAWNHVAMTINRGAADTTRLYHNGAQVAQATITQQFASAPRGFARFGRDWINPNSDVTYAGRIDEPRFSNVTRGADYVKLSYETQRPGATAVTQGAATPSTPAVPSPAAAPLSPSGLNYTLTTATYKVDTAIAPNTATVTGTVDTFFVVPALPAGLSLNPVTGAITGTPTAASAQATYTVVAANTSGTSIRALTLTVQTVTSVRPGAFAFRVAGAARPYAFAISEHAALATEALTLAITDASGRVVWSRAVNPSRDGVRELVWDGFTASGARAPAGMYVVTASAVRDGQVVRLNEKTVTLRPR